MNQQVTSYKITFALPDVSSLFWLSKCLTRELGQPNRNEKHYTMLILEKTPGNNFTEKLQLVQERCYLSY